MIILSDFKSGIANQRQLNKLVEPFGGRQSIIMKHEVLMAIGNIKEEILRL